jgi:carbon-monoxide dehydrogenase medium subunit
VKPAPFDYLAPKSVDEAVAALTEHGDDGKVLAGGQSLVPLLNMRLALPSVVVDISRIQELRATTELPSGGWRYGSATVHAAFEDRRVPDATGGLLHHVAGGIGYRAVRNRGTLGGSLAHADASAEWPVVMAAVDARVAVRSARAERTIPARVMVEGFFTSALESDELVVAVEVDPLPSGSHWGFCKSARKPGEFAESLAVAVIGPSGATVWLGAAREVPVPVALPALRGPDDWSPATRAEVQEAVHQALAGADADADGDARYHRHLHAVTACRAIDVAFRPSVQEPQP